MTLDLLLNSDVGLHLRQFLHPLTELVLYHLGQGPLPDFDESTNFAEGLEDPGSLVDLSTIDPSEAMLIWLYENDYVGEHSIMQAHISKDTFAYLVDKNLYWEISHSPTELVDYTTKMNLAAFNGFNDLYKLHYNTSDFNKYELIANNLELIEFVLERYSTDSNYSPEQNISKIIKALIKLHKGDVCAILNKYAYIPEFDKYVFYYVAKYDKCRIFANYINKNNVDSDSLLHNAIKYNSSDMVNMITFDYITTIDMFHVAAEHNNIGLIDDLLTDGHEWSAGTLQIMCNNRKCTVIPQYYKYESNPAVIRDNLTTNDLATLQFAHKIGAINDGPMFRCTSNPDVMIWLLERNPDLIQTAIDRKHYVAPVVKWLYHNGHLSIQQVMLMATKHHTIKTFDMPSGQAHDWHCAFSGQVHDWHNDNSLLRWAQKHGAKANKELFAELVSEKKYDRITIDISISAVGWFLRQGYPLSAVYCRPTWRRWYVEAKKYYKL